MKEIGTDWYRGKNAPGFLPTGPFLVPAPFVANPGDLHLQLTLNGDTMQDATTSDLLFDIPALIAGASHCDFESPSDWMCRLACGDTDPARQQRVRQALLDAAARWLPVEVGQSRP